jgi:hypothetical protein
LRLPALESFSHKLFRLTFGKPVSQVPFGSLRKLSLAVFKVMKSMPAKDFRILANLSGILPLLQFAKNYRGLLLVRRRFGSRLYAYLYHTVTRGRALPIVIGSAPMLYLEKSYFSDITSHLHTALAVRWRLEGRQLPGSESTAVAKRLN